MYCKYHKREPSYAYYHPADTQMQKKHFNGTSYDNDEFN